MRQQRSSFRTAETEQLPSPHTSYGNKIGEIDKAMKTKLKKGVGLLCACLALASLSLTAWAAPTSLASQAPSHGEEVIVGGCLFGVRMYTEGVMVVGLDKISAKAGQSSHSPAHEAGIRMKDILLEIDGKPVTDNESVTRSITESGGRTLTVRLRRDGKDLTLSLTPALNAEGKYAAGFWLRDAAAGVGTVTYVKPQTGEFGGLGHGICDGDTGALLPLKRGAVSEVELLGIVKGQRGTPGEVKGAFSGGKCGALIRNTPCGAYGVFTTVPASLGERMKTASRDEIKEGGALLRCAVDGTVRDYSVNISAINHGRENGKNFTVTIMDSSLLAITGGIVQGMSGSPIIQNGKLVGAVTHVTINDPTQGYGIFIENMLKAENLSIALAS